MTLRRKTMTWTVVVAAALAFSPASAQDLQQKLAAAKAAASANQQALRAYSWIEKTEISLKGEVKNTKVEMCRYGADGKLQKTPVVEPPPPKRARGVKGRIIEKKTEELKDELEAAVALIRQYVPPAPDMLQAVMTAGRASAAQAGPGRTALTFPGYAKPGDGLTLAFDPAVKALQQIDISSWLDKPDDAVTLRVMLTQLPDGTSHPASIVLGLPGRNLEVRVTHSNYQKVAP